MYNDLVLGILIDRLMHEKCFEVDFKVWGSLWFWVPCVHVRVALLAYQVFFVSEMETKQNIAGHKKKEFRSQNQLV